MGSDARRDVDHQETSAVLEALVYDEGQRRRGPLKDGTSYQLGRVISHSANQRFVAIFGLVVDAEDNPAAIRVCEADGRIRNELERLLGASRRLLEIQLLALQVACGYTIPQPRQNLV
jgi:hypothetical protein